MGTIIKHGSFHHISIFLTRSTLHQLNPSNFHFTTIFTLHFRSLSPWYLSFHFHYSDPSNRSNRDKQKQRCLFSVHGLSFSFLWWCTRQTHLYSQYLLKQVTMLWEVSSLWPYITEFTSQATMGKGSRDQTACKAVFITDEQACRAAVLVCMLHASLCTCKCFALVAELWDR